MRKFALRCNFMQGLMQDSLKMFFYGFLRPSVNSKLFDFYSSKFVKLVTLVMFWLHICHALFTLPVKKRQGKS